MANQKAKGRKEEAQEIVISVISFLDFKATHLSLKEQSVVLHWHMPFMFIYEKKNSITKRTPKR